MTKTAINFPRLATKKAGSTVLAGIVSLMFLAAVVDNVSSNYALAQISNGTNNTITPLPPVSGNTHNTNENETTVGDQVSDFVHQAVQSFKQERQDIVQVIHECHANLANATASDRSQIMDSCKANLSAIHEKYTDMRTKYHELFKQFKENMHVFLKEARGLPVDPQEKRHAIEQIMDTRQHMIKEGHHDALQGMQDIIKGHKMINSGHPIAGKEMIEKGKQQIRVGVHDVKKAK